MDSPHFTKINESFQCANCGHQVPAASKTCRNHCTVCLYSLHVDIKPGDRLNPCGGVMEPAGYVTHAKKGIVLIHRCRRCQQITRNKAAHEDATEADDYDAILRLTKSAH